MFSDDKIGLAQSCQFGIIVQNAKRTKKIQIYIRCKRPNSVGWVKPFFTILQIHWSQTLSTDLCLLACLPSQNLSPSRSFVSSYLCHCIRNWTNREYPITYSQWAYPTHFGFARISSSGHIENVSMEVQLTKFAKPSTSTRQIPNRTVSSSRATLFRYHRCGYDSLDCLRASRVCQDGLQPQISWKTFLCTSYFLRRKNWIFSINGFKIRQCPSCKRSIVILRTHNRKTAKHYGFLQNSYTLGCIFLQQRYHTAFRREKHWLRHCNKDAQLIEIANTVWALPRICQRLGSSRIYFPSSKFQERASFYCHKTPKTSRARRGSKEPFYLQRLCLSQGLGYQLRPYSRSRMEILLQQRLPRTSASGIQEFFFYGSDSYQKFLGKCYLHGNNSLGIRPGFSFSIPMPTRKSPALEHFNPSQRTLVASSRMGKTWQLQYFTATKTISTTGIVFQDSKSNIKGQVFDLGQFANIFFISLTRAIKKSPFIAVFQVVSG
jgi:hypothetical protein